LEEIVARDAGDGSLKPLQVVRESLGAIDQFAGC
jgi:hypothetical protein